MGWGMIVVLVGGFAGAAAPIPSSPVSSQVGSPAVIQLQYPGVLRDADVPTPAARVTVAGRSAWFLFDTGAGIHTLASWFAKAAGLGTAELEGMSGRDSTGRRLQYRVARAVRLSLDAGGEIALGDAAVADFPPFFEEHEVGGALSPQLLAPTGSAAVLDLRRPELRIEAFDAAISRIGAVELRRGPVLEICSERAPLPNRLFAVRVSVGGESASLILDSGAAHSKLNAASRAARRLPGPLEDGTSTGLNGVVDPVKVARRVRVSLGKHDGTADVRVGPLRNSCGPDGILGLDVIRDCVFVLGEERVAYACEMR